jgi:cold shock protein
MTRKFRFRAPETVLCSTPLGLALRSASANGSGGVNGPQIFFKTDRQRLIRNKVAKLSDSDCPVGSIREGRSGEHDGGSFPMAMTGTVKFFNAERGYGFIKPDDGGRDVFVHVTAVERAGLKDLAEGQRITFEVEPDKKGKGPKAVNLVVS